MNFLLNLVFAVAIFSGIHQVSADDDIIKMQTECFKEAGIAGGQSIDPPDVQRQKFSFCFAQKLGIMNSSGDILEDNLKAFVKKRVADENKANKIAEKCAIQKENAGQTADELFTCLKVEGVRT